MTSRLKNHKRLAVVSALAALTTITVGGVTAANAATTHHSTKHVATHVSKFVSTTGDDGITVTEVPGAVPTDVQPGIAIPVGPVDPGSGDSGTTGPGPVTG
jgi:hypothetical protein